MTGASHHRVAVVGAGFGGIGASISLARQGIPHVIFEKAPDVGGTWWANTYPGCRCDVPSHLYSFSFAPNPEWSETFSSQPEILDYLRRVADDYGVTPRIRFGTEVLAARWDTGAMRWVIETSAGTHTADVLIAAHGLLSEPSVPAIEGMDSFAGELMHSARWDSSIPLEGRTVAVVGTGASAVQLIPEIHKRVGRLLVFQRTAAWILPHSGRTIRPWEKALYRRLPAAQRGVRHAVYYGRELVLLPSLLKSVRLGAIRRLSMRHLEAQVEDPELRRKLTPTFVPGCKRLTPTNDYLPAIASPKTELVTERISRITPEGIVTDDGVLHPADVIVLATGFKVTDNTFAARVTGRDGRTMRDVWDADSMAAYNGTTVAGFPNLFMLAGPNTGIGHTSLVYMIEAQLPYVLGAIAHLDATGARAVEVRPDIQAAFNEGLQRRLVSSVWTTGGCSSWYLDSFGRNSTIWPDFTFNFARRLSRFDPEAYYQQYAPASLSA